MTEAVPVAPASAVPDAGPPSEPAVATSTSAASGTADTAPAAAGTAAPPVPTPPAGDAGGTATLVEQASDALDRAGAAVSGAVGRVAEVTKEAAGHVADRIRNNATVPAQRGSTHIANEVVEKIAGCAAREVPGVYDLGGDVARVFAAVRERLHLGEEATGRGVAVRLEGRSAAVEITIVIEFGFVVSSVTDKVREKVISAIESLLGLEVTSVDIVVDDVHLDNDGPVGDDAARAAGYRAETQAITVG